MNVVATHVEAVRAASRSNVENSTLVPSLSDVPESAVTNQNVDSGFKYLTALRQNSPGAKSWG